MSHVAKKLLTVVAAGAVLMAATNAWAIADAGAKCAATTAATE